MLNPYKLPQRRKRVKSGIERAPQREWPRHRKFVRSHHCIVPGCENPDIECCHIRSAFDAGTGLKPPDWCTFPACRFHHDEQHRIGQGSFEDRHGLDLDAIAAALTKLSPDRKMYIARLEASLDSATIPIVANPLLPQPKDTPHVPHRRQPPDDCLANPRLECAARPAFHDADHSTALVGEQERQGIRHRPQDGRESVPAEVSRGAGRRAQAHLQRPELAHLERGLGRAAPRLVPPGEGSTLKADIVRELRAVAERPIARVYRGEVAQAQAVAIWRGLIEPAKALGFVQITRLGRKVLALAGEPAPIPRKTVEVYAPVVVRARVA